MLIKWTPEEVYNILTEKLESLNPDKEIYVYFGEKLTTEIRTKAQNNMFQWVFTQIWNHLWEKKDDVKMYFLAWMFWTKTLKLSQKEYEFPIISHTSDLTKEQAMDLISILFKFIAKHKVPCKYTPRDLQSLYDNY